MFQKPHHWDSEESCGFSDFEIQVNAGRSLKRIILLDQINGSCSPTFHFEEWAIGFLPR